MGKILFFSCEPGGAEVLAPVVQLLQKRPEYEIEVAGYGYGLDRFTKRGIVCHKIEVIEKEDTSLLERWSPDLVISSACSLPAADMSEKHLWYNCRLMNIPSIAFLDQWQNYTLRFSGQSVAEKMSYLPDYINCLNEIGKQEMLGEGFPLEKLIVLGHPYLSAIVKQSKQLDVEALRAKLGIPLNAPVVLFVSEPIREYYGGVRGYDQYRVLKLLLENLENHVPGAYIIVKLHPKDNQASYSSLCSQFKMLGITFISDELSPLECNALADHVFGMTSIMLIEAYLMKKKVISIQPGLCVSDPLVLSRYGYIPVIRNDDFAISLSSEPFTPEFEYQFNEEGFWTLYVECGLAKTSYKAGYLSP